MLNIIELVRKIKAHDNLSIKAEVAYIEATQSIYSSNLIEDLKNVTSAKEIRFVENLSDNIQDLSSGDLHINVVYSIQY